MTLPKPMTSGAKSEGRFGKQDFVYLPEEDVYRCPAGEKLKYSLTAEEHGQKLRRYWTNACRACAIKDDARPARSAASRGGSTSTCSKPAQKRLDENPQAMRQRRETVEHPFGTLKMRMGATHFLMKTAAEGRHRDGAARARLQPHPRDEHRRREAAPGGDPNLRCGSSRRPQVTQ